MNIIIISPNFPPETGVAVLRIMSLSKFLIENGHHVTVLTSKKNSQIPTRYASDAVEVYTERFLKYNHYFAFIMLQKAYKEKLEMLLKQKKYEMVLITGGPFYTFQLTKLCKKYSIKSVLDFRDPWVFDFRGLKDILSIKRTVSRAIYTPMERVAVKYADAVTTVTPGWVDTFKRLYPLQKKKFFLIENGYDDELLKHIHIESAECRSENNGAIVFGVFGKMFYYSEYYSRVFLLGLKMFTKSKDTIRIIQVGEKEPNADSLIASVGLNESILCTTGILPYEEGIREISKADVFVMIDSRKQALGTKIYDYLYLRKPILYVGPEKSAFADILHEYGHASVCSKPEQVLEAIHCYMESTTRRHDFDSYMDIKRFSRSSNNKKWMSLLENIVDL